MSLALNPGASPKPTPKAKEPKRLTGKPHRIPPKVVEAMYAMWGRTCLWCERPGGALDAHHILRRSQGGKDAPENLRPLHRICHRYVHEHPEEARQRGLLVGTGTKS